MEGAILLGLASVGYLLNKDNNNTNKIESNVKPAVFENTNTSIYDLNNVADAQNYESKLVGQNFQQTLNNGSNMVSDFNAKTRSLEPKSDIIIGLDGNPISKENFLVNDQGIKVEPFYSGEGPPAVDLTRNTNLDRTNGLSDYRFTHRETKHNGVNLHGPPQPYANGNPFGLSNTGPAMDQERYDPGMYKTNELPFGQERISHIDRNSEINRDVGDLFAQRNNIDNTRALSNQKMSYGGRIVSGKGIDERGVEGQVFKHLPDQDYEQGADRWLVTKAAVEGDRIRPAQILPETNRQYLNRQDIGTPGSSINLSEEKRPMFKKTDRQQLASDTMRNATGTEVYVDGDHSQSSYKVYANEREVTGERTYEGNTGYFVPANTIQNQDMAKTSIKETTLNPASPNGFSEQVTISPEQRLFDGAKTSKKETVLFDHMGGARASTLQSSAQDQYFRADLNPNKEIISQGRAPTTESTKLSNGMDTINMDIKKIESDYFTHHQTGVERVYQNIPTDVACEYTRDKDTLDNEKLAYRIEGDLLDPFKHNPYTQSLHSFAY
jgi:hypothetical protein